jgi:hypothetical protein
MSPPPRLSESSLTPSDLSSGRAGGGGPFFLVGGAGCETVRVDVAGLVFSIPSGTVPMVFFLPNQLLLFRLDSVGAWLWMVAGEPGRSEFKLSDDGSDRSPRNFRTEDGRLWGLVGDSVPLAASLDRGWCSPSPTTSSSSLPFADPFLWGNTPDCGVGCDDRGPLPGVGGRGLSGGESGGAGIEVPSVREKLMGVSVSGLYLVPAMVKGRCVVDGAGAVGQSRAMERAGTIDGRGLCNSDWRSIVEAASRRGNSGGGAKGSTRLRTSRDRSLHDTRRTRARMRRGSTSANCKQGINSTITRLPGQTLAAEKTRGDWQHSC